MKCNASRVLLQKFDIRYKTLDYFHRVHISGTVISKSEFNSAIGDCFLGGEYLNLLFISDIVKLLLKTNAQRQKT